MESNEFFKVPTNATATNSQTIARESGPGPKTPGTTNTQAVISDFESRNDND